MTVPTRPLDIRGPIDDHGRNVLLVAGDVNLRTAPQLRDRITEAGEDGRTVVIDLRDVQFMDSPGLGTLIYCGKVLEEHGSALVARAPSGNVRELFELVQLGTILTIE